MVSSDLKTERLTNIQKGLVGCTPTWKKRISVHGKHTNTSPKSVDSHGSSGQTGPCSYTLNRMRKQEQRINCPLLEDLLLKSGLT